MKYIKNILFILKLIIGQFRTISLDDTDSLSVQEAVYTASVFSNRIPMKSRRSSSQADSILHALAPPSHTLKARRLSKNNDSEPGQGEMKRKRSIVHEYQKELSSHSAVSPRFMTLRKLSEVTVVSNRVYNSHPPCSSDISCLHMAFHLQTVQIYLLFLTYPIFTPIIIAIAIMP